MKHKDMKKIMILFAMLAMGAVSGYSQVTVYRSTGDNVNVRKGPGTNFGRVQLSGGVHCGSGIAQLWKGALVESDGKQKNGFVHVKEMGPNECWDEGWVSAKYLTKATKCTTCNGKGTTGRKCPQCGGEGIYVCCAYTGMEPCPKCGISGYY